jgi:hypothetical protein
MNDQDQNQINNTDGNGTPSQKSDRPKARHPLILTGTYERRFGYKAYEVALEKVRRRSAEQVNGIPPTRR